MRLWFLSIFEKLSSINDIIIYFISSYSISFLLPTPVIEIIAGRTINPNINPKSPLITKNVAKGGNKRITEGNRNAAAASVVQRAEDTGDANIVIDFWSFPKTERPELS